MTPPNSSDANPGCLCHTHCVRQVAAYVRLCVEIIDPEWDQSAIICHESVTWRRCNLCEHCVPVNTTTHYPVALPAQADWLPHSVSLFCLRLCHHLLDFVISTATSTEITHRKINSLQTSGVHSHCVLTTWAVRTNFNVSWCIWGFRQDWKCRLKCIFQEPVQKTGAVTKSWTHTRKKWLEPRHMGTRRKCAEGEQSTVWTLEEQCLWMQVEQAITKEGREERMWREETSVPI